MPRLYEVGPPDIGEDLIIHTCNSPITISSLQVPDSWARPSTTVDALNKTIPVSLYIMGSQSASVLIIYCAIPTFGGCFHFWFVCTCSQKWKQENDGNVSSQCMRWAGWKPICSHSDYQTSNAQPHCYGERGICFSNNCGTSKTIPCCVAKIDCFLPIILLVQWNFCHDLEEDWHCHLAYC